MASELLAQSRAEAASCVCCLSRYPLWGAGRERRCRDYLIERLVQALELW